MEETVERVEGDGGPGGESVGLVVGVVTGVDVVVEGFVGVESLGGRRGREGEGGGGRG